MRFLSVVFLAALLGGAQAAAPAPLTGIWQLTGSSAAARPTPQAPTGVLVIGTTVRGQVGCGTFRGTIQAGAGAVALQPTPDAPASGVRCLYALPAPFLSALNGGARHVLSADTRRLVLYGARARFAFERVGYVTPTPKGS